MDRRAHWEEVYTQKQTDQVSWFESEPSVSLDLIKRTGLVGGRIIDIGGGASFLVDRLVSNTNWQMTVLDISRAAIDHAKSRLGDLASRVHWICDDITTTTELPTYDVWHDRAVFHFLSQPEDRQVYLDRLNTALADGGYFLVSTFASDGPDKCSGLPVCRYNARDLQALLGPRFRLTFQQTINHLTPSGTLQKFTTASFQKSSTGSLIQE